MEWTGQLQFAIVSNITKIEDLFVFGKGSQAGPKGVTVNMNLVNSNLISMTIRVSWDTSIHLKTFFFDGIKNHTLAFFTNSKWLN